METKFKVFNARLSHKNEIQELMDNVNAYLNDGWKVFSTDTAVGFSSDGPRYVVTLIRGDVNGQI